MGAVEDGQACVWVFMHPDRGAHEVRPKRARRKLQGEGAPFDGVVVADTTLLLDTQDRTGLAGATGHEGAASLFGRDREGGVVLRQVALGR